MIGVSTCGGKPGRAIGRASSFALRDFFFFLLFPGAIRVSRKYYRVLIERSTASLGQQSTFNPADF
jgi:hypothetical protein